MRVCGVVVGKVYWSAVRNRRGKKGEGGFGLPLIYKYFIGKRHRMTETGAEVWMHGTGTAQLARPWIQAGFRLAL
ncbi:hypothetical protein CCP4SC76_2290010 [Gammaproteobacteria bacterium]